HRPAEPDALHISFVENLEGSHCPIRDAGCLILDAKCHLKFRVASSFHLYEYTRQKLPPSPSTRSTEIKYWPLFGGVNPAAAFSPLLYLSVVICFPVSS